MAEYDPISGLTYPEETPILRPQVDPFGGFPQNPMAAALPQMAPTFDIPELAPQVAPQVAPPQPAVQRAAPPPMPAAAPGFSFGGFEQTAPPQPQADNLSPYQQIIRGMESSHNYSQMGDNGTSFGAYQVQAANIPEWTRRWYGRALTPQEFLRNPEAQDAVFRGQFGEYLRQAGGDAVMAARMWQGGANQRAWGPRNEAYGRVFASRLSQAGVQRPSEPMAAPMMQGGQQQLEMSPELQQLAGQFGLTAQPTPGPVAGPAPVSPVASAMAPGLAAQRPAMGAVNQFLEPMRQALFGDAPIVTGRGGILDYIDSFRGARSPRDYNAAQEEAAAAVFTRGQQLRAENPQANAQQLAQMLIRDPVFGQNALLLGSKGPAVLQAAVQPPTGAPTFQGFGPGQAIYQNQGGQLSQLGTTPTAPAQMLQWLLGLPPEQQQAALQMMAAQAGALSRPSDREQAVARIEADRAGGRQPNPNDLLIAGWIRQYPIIGPAGNVVMSPPENVYERFMGAAGAPGQPATTAPVVGGAVPQATPPVGGTAPFSFGEPMVPGLSAPQGAPPAPRQLDTRPRVVGRRGERDIVDIPDLALQTSLISDPAHIALGAGPISAFRGAWGRVVGNMLPMVEEETLSRQSLLQDFRSAFASYRPGVRLASEHLETMAVAPSPGRLYTNVLESINQFITIREGLVRDLQLATQQAADPSLDTSTRKTASDKVAEIRGLLMRTPSLEGLFNLRDQIRRGEDLGTGVPSYESLTGQGSQAADKLTGDVTKQAPSTGRSALPENLKDLSTADLQRLAAPSRSNRLSPQDRARLMTELEDRTSRVPRSE